MVRGYKILGLDDLAKETLRVLESNFPGYSGIAQSRELKVTK
jgi:outer membrane protein assembly factor BamD